MYMLSEMMKESGKKYEISPGFLQNVILGGALLGFRLGDAGYLSQSR